MVCSLINVDLFRVFLQIVLSIDLCAFLILLSNYFLLPCFAPGHHKSYYTLGFKLIGFHYISILLNVFHFIIIRLFNLRGLSLTLSSLLNILILFFFQFFIYFYDLFWNVIIEHYLWPLISSLWLSSFGSFRISCNSFNDSDISKMTSANRKWLKYAPFIYIYIYMSLPVILSSLSVSYVYGIV